MAKNNNKNSSDEELAKQQEELNNKQAELAKKAEERAKKRAADITERNRINAEQQAASQQSDNDIPDPNANNQQTSNFTSEDQNSSNVNSSEENFGNQSVENPDDLENDIPTDVLEEMDIPDEIVSELEEITNTNSSEDVQMPDDDFDPLKEKVIKRSYTDGNLGAKKEESQQTSQGANGLGVNDIPPIEPIISEPVINVVNPQVETEGAEVSSTSTKTTTPKAPPVNPKLDDLSASQKRKAAEKTADALITTYANLVPIPFKKMSSFNIRKLEQRHMNDELDMNMIIMEDGTKVRDYCEGVNEQAESTFVVTKEMQEEIKDPLIDVLLENNFALTPTQRLVMVVGGQIVQMGITAIQFMQQNSNAMDSFKKFHEENKAIRTQASAAVTQEPTSNQEPVREEIKNQNSNVKSDIPEQEDVRTTAKNSTTPNISSDIPEDKETVLGDKVSLEDFLNEGDDNNK